MNKSACLKVQINSQPPLLLSFSDFDAFAALEDANVAATSDLDDAFVVATLLNSLCFLRTAWSDKMPIRHVLTIRPDIFVGDFTATETVDSITFAGFTQDSLKAALINGLLPEGLDEISWSLLVQSTPFNDLQSMMAANYLTDFTVITERTIVKILRCSQADIDALGDALGVPTVAYTDAFALVKRYLTRNNPSLDTQGLAPAKYVANGDYIELISAGAIIQNYEAS